MRILHKQQHLPPLEGPRLHEPHPFRGAGVPPDEHDGALRRMEEELRTFRTADGRPYTLIPLPMADPAFDPEDGHRLPATYANFLILNGAVLVPTYASPKDALALNRLARAFPDREITGIDCRPLIRQHGSLHCVTMQFPTRFL